MVLRNTGQVSYRMSLNLALSIVLFITSLELWVLEKQILQRWSLLFVPFYQGYMISTWHLWWCKLIIWLRLYLLDFSTVKLLIFSLSPYPIFCESLRLTYPQNWGRWIPGTFILSSFHIWPQMNVMHLSKWWSHSVKMHSCFQKLYICNKYMPDTKLDAKHWEMKLGHWTLDHHLFNTHILSAYSKQTVVGKKQNKTEIVPDSLEFFSLAMRISVRLWKH